MAIGFFVQSGKDGPIHGLSGGFHDALLQERIISFLASESDQVDPFDGGVFGEQSLIELHANVASAIAMLGRQDPNWGMSSEELRAYYSRGKSYRLNLLPPAQQAMADMSRLLELVERACSDKLQVVFTGD